MRIMLYLFIWLASSEMGLLFLCLLINSSLCACIVKFELAGSLHVIMVLMSQFSVFTSVIQ